MFAWTILFSFWEASPPAIVLYSHDSRCSSSFNNLSSTVYTLCAQKHRAIDGRFSLLLYRVML